MIAISCKITKKKSLFIHCLVCGYTQIHAHFFVNTAKKYKIKQEPLEKAKLFTRFSETKLLGHFCILTLIHNHWSEKFTITYQRSFQNNSDVIRTNFIFFTHIKR